MRNVLITGGTGFCGFWMQKTWPKNYIKSLGIENQQHYETFQWESLEWDAIVHLAPISPARVLKYAQRHNTRVLFASSGAVYNGTNAYAYNKRLWEQQCQDSGVDYIIARLFTFVGEHLKNHYAITNFIESAKNGKPLQVWGDGSTVRSYLYGDDLGKWMWSLLLNRKGVYDVGSIIPYTILEVARIVADIIPAKIQILNDGHPSTRYLPDTTRARTELGLKETVGLKDAICQTIK